MKLFWGSNPIILTPTTSTDTGFAPIIRTLDYTEFCESDPFSYLPIIPYRILKNFIIYKDSFNSWITWKITFLFCLYQIGKQAWWYESGFSTPMG